MPAQIVRRSLTLAAVLAGLALSSCATLSKEECASVDWRELGRGDGTEGRAPGHIERHRDTCRKHGLPVDEQTWLSGWEIGIRAYCTPQNGLRQGREGFGYAKSCPADLAPGFENAYETGRRVYWARSERDRIRGEIDRLLREVGRQPTEQDRRNMRFRISSLETQLFLAQQQVREAERAYDRYVAANGLGR